MITVLLTSPNMLVTEVDGNDRVLMGDGDDDNGEYQDQRVKEWRVCDYG